MAEYKAVDDQNPAEIVGFLLARLERAKDGRGALAKWAQNELSAMVAIGYVVPTVCWRIRDTMYGKLEGPEYATKELALAARRRMGGNSARYRVEPVSVAS